MIHRVGRAAHRASRSRIGSGSDRVGGSGAINRNGGDVRGRGSRSAADRTDLAGALRSGGLGRLGMSGRSDRELAGYPAGVAGVGWQIVLSIRPKSGPASAGLFYVRDYPSTARP